ncbi:MAG: hypothetical protein ACLU3F_15205 [Blautia wexlerae]
MTKGLAASSTYGYTRWEDFAQRLDRVLAAFIETYHPRGSRAWACGMSMPSAGKLLGLTDALEGASITPGFLGA